MKRSVLDRMRHNPFIPSTDAPVCQRSQGEGDPDAPVGVEPASPSKVARGRPPYVHVPTTQDSPSFVRWHCLRQRNVSPHEPPSLSAGSSPYVPATQFDAAVPGVKETPRRTSRMPAVRTVVKLSVAGRLVAAKLSVITTSLFGSAPWSPFPLTVEVTPQIVTVPSPFTRPVMLRRPSVAGAHGSPVAKFVPVG